METKHTKGEWKVNGKYKTITDSEGYGIAQENGIHNSQEWEANAKLIAAAPELLEALKKLYNAIDSCVDLTPELLKECKKAIKKATE